MEERDHGGAISSPSLSLSALGFFSVVAVRSIAVYGQRGGNLDTYTQSKERPFQGARLARIFCEFVLRSTRVCYGLAEFVTILS